MGLFDNLFGKKEEFFLELGDAKAGTLRGTRLFLCE